MPYLYLTIAIIGEVIGTSSLKAAEGFTRLWPSLLVVAGYAVAFYCLSLTLKHLPIGTTYAMWSGLGVVLVALVGWLIFGQKVDLWGALGMGLIIAGVVVLNFVSKTATH
ncbi:DMT family transporter [Pseudooceanicola onchidii]|uniref:DMT family transporter n=1 Tax=Pseudooceanicola onchidii TaxID=2562279 RepID=UPI0010AAAB4D|nr:SMR family transporter [Pseudooceanicola onchidii]